MTFTTSHVLGWLYFFFEKRKITNVNENVEKLLYIVDSTANTHTKQLWHFLKKLNIGLLYDSVISLVSICLKELKAGT